MCPTNTSSHYFHQHFPFCTKKTTKMSITHTHAKNDDDDAMMILIKCTKMYIVHTQQQRQNWKWRKVKHAKKMKEKTNVVTPYKFMRFIRSSKIYYLCTKIMKVKKDKISLSDPNTRSLKHIYRALYLFCLVFRQSFLHRTTHTHSLIFALRLSST